MYDFGGKNISGLVHNFFFFCATRPSHFVLLFFIVWEGTLQAKFEWNGKIPFYFSLYAYELCAIKITL